MIDGVLMLGFGGPTPGCCQRRATCPRQSGCEAECFVAGILGDNPLRAQRVREVVAHYRALGGFSPYNQLSYAQSQALATTLAARGRALPVAFGFRHWVPWAATALEDLQRQGCRSLAVLVMAPHQSTVSWDWYLKLAAEASEAMGERSPRLVAVIAPWWSDPGFISALVARLREATSTWSRERIAQAALLFTAHAIPRPVEQTAPYRQQFAETAELTAQAFGHPNHRIAFQSQPSDSGIPWSAPAVSEVISELGRSGVRDVLVCAAGFLVDHTEVLYDLDIEAAAAAQGLGMVYTRARSVHEHPAFITMLAERVMALQAH